MDGQLDHPTRRQRKNRRYRSLSAGRRKMTMVDLPPPPKKTGPKRAATRHAVKAPISSSPPSPKLLAPISSGPRAPKLLELEMNTEDEGSSSPREGK